MLCGVAVERPRGALDQIGQLELLHVAAGQLAVQGIDVGAMKEAVVFGDGLQGEKGLCRVDGEAQVGQGVVHEEV